MARLSGFQAANGECTWKEYPTGDLGVANLAYPIVGSGGELFVLGNISGKRGRAALRLDGKWEIVAERHDPVGPALRAWRDSNGDL